MIKSVLFRCVLFLVIVHVCSCVKRNTSEIKYSVDTIKVNRNEDYLNSKYKCSNIFNGYYERFGISIQKYYTINDSLAIDINDDGLIDTLLVLSPLPLENPDIYDCLIKLSSNRIIVEILNNNGKSKIQNIYPNLISNVGGVLSNYSGISKMKNGFKIKHSAGNKYSWEYSVEYSFSTDGLFIKKIIKECAFESSKDTKEYVFSNYKASKFNIIDSLGNNCNCDNAWELLESKN